MGNSIIIFVCSNGHHSLDNNLCPFCGKKPIKTVEYRDGDCIDCGNLCPSYAYGCNTPYPLKIDSNYTDGHK